MRTLIAMTAPTDPFCAGVLAGVEMEGPVLSAARFLRPDRIVLLGEQAGAVTAALIERGLVADSAGVTSAVETAAAVQAVRGEGIVLAGPAAAAVLALALCEAGLPCSLAEVRESVPGGGPDVTVAPVAAARSRVVREPRAGYAVQLPDTDFDPPIRIARIEPPPSREETARRVGLIGDDPVLLREIERAAAVASHPVPVLIQGETGAGKGVMARFVHAMSDRRNGPFVAVNCAALPEQLVESILFGHVKGAFTGAGVDQTGKFALADGGTLFLDEIGELPLAQQPKLLKVLEDGVVEPLGASKGRRIDVRVLAATNRDLGASVAARQFREDLFFRLSFTRLTLPSLRERRGDIAALALHILARFNGRLKRPRRFTPAALRRLAASDWPGNVRDLENVVGRSALLCPRDEIDAADLLFDSPSPSADPVLPELQEGFSLEAHLDLVRKMLVEKALSKSGGNRSAAARLLGVSPQAVHQYLRGRES